MTIIKTELGSEDSARRLRFEPTGNISATDTQKAIEEVASETPPVDADYLVRTAHANLSAERVVTDTSTVAWDWATDGQAKAKRAALTGDVTADADSNDTTIANGAVTSAKLADDAVTNDKLGNMATQTLKGRTTAGTGDPEDLTATQATALLNAFTGDSGSGGVKGLVPAPASGDAAAGKFLKADGTFAVPGAASGVSTFNGLSGTVEQDIEGHNPIINPEGIIWQVQNTGAAAVTDGTYCFDQWYGLTQTAGVTASQLTDVENGTPFMMRLSQANASAQRFGLAQVLERRDCIHRRGQTVVLSARVRMSASTTLRYAILEWTGTADSLTKDVVADWTSGTFTAGNFFLGSNLTVTATGSAALTANTLTTVSVSGTLGSSMNNLYVLFWTDSTQAQNVTLDVAKVKLERGSTATPYSPENIERTLSQCQRFYEKSYNLATAPGTSAAVGFKMVYVVSPAANGQYLGGISFLVTKRQAPAVTVYGYSGTVGTVSNSGATDQAANSGTVTGQGESGFNIFNGSGGSILASGNVALFHYVADARL